MWCQGTVLINTENGKRYVRASVYGDTTPSTMPTTGAGISGLNGDDILYAGSVFYAVDTGDIYMMNSQNTWVEQ